MNTSALWDEIYTILNSDSALRTLLGGADRIVYDSPDNAPDTSEGTARLVVHSLDISPRFFEANVYWLGITMTGSNGPALELIRDKVIQLLHGATLSTSGALSITQSDGGQRISYDGNIDKYSGLITFDVRGS